MAEGWRYYLAYYFPFSTSGPSPRRSELTMDENFGLDVPDAIMLPM